MKTITAKQMQWSDRKWFLVDANGQTLWKLATKIATILRWKNKVDFVSHLDNWDYVVVINCDKFNVTWNKMEDKIYYKHSWFLGWLKETPLNDLLVKKPMKPLELAIFWMMPKNKLKKSMLSRLKLFTWAEHIYWAQKPEIIKL